MGGGSYGGSSGANKQVNNQKFYSILEIDNTANDDEIRKAYKKKIRTMHPDKGGDKEKVYFIPNNKYLQFQELQYAYDVLSDKDKRAIYDKYGEEGLKEGRVNEGNFFNKKTNSCGSTHLNINPPQILMLLILHTL